MNWKRRLSPATVILLSLVLLCAPLSAQQASQYPSDLVHTFVNGPSGIETGMIAPGVFSPSLALFDGADLLVSDSMGRRLAWFDPSFAKTRELRIDTYFNERRGVLFDGLLVGWSLHSVTFVWEDGHHAYLQMTTLVPDYRSESAVGVPLGVIGWDLSGRPHAFRVSRGDHQSSQIEAVTVAALVEELHSLHPELDVAIDDSGRLFFGGELRTNDYETHFEFWNEEYENYGRVAGHRYPVWTPSAMVSFIGRDKDNNTYWIVSAAKLVQIYNDQGIVIDRLRIDGLMSAIDPVVHSSGDIYWISYDPEQVWLHRITRAW